MRWTSAAADLARAPVEHLTATSPPLPWETVGGGMAAANNWYQQWMAGRRAVIEDAVRAIGPVPGGRVVDVACGDAGLTGLVAGIAGAKAFGQDWDQRECRAAMRSGTPVARGDVRRLPFQNEVSDITLAFEIVEHIEPWEAPGFIDELWRITKPGGHLLLSTPNRYSIRSFQGLAHYMTHGTVWNAEDQTHVLLYTPWQIRKLVSRRFQVERQYGYSLLPHLRGKPSRTTFWHTERRAVGALCHKQLLVARKSPVPGP